jgi:probable phosphoglycerate mutase
VADLSPIAAVSAELPLIVLARHGETAWSVSGQHTGRTDIPLTPNGERDALWLGERLRGFSFAKVLSSPLRRASKTCELAGFKERMEMEPNLVEWDYGQYEGRKTVDIRAERSDWELFRDGCPGGEMPPEVGARADQIIGRLHEVQGNVLLFSSGHILRVLTARWLGLEPSDGRGFVLSTASVSILGYEHNLSRPALRLWNDTSHLNKRARS